MFPNMNTFSKLEPCRNHCKQGLQNS